MRSRFVVALVAITTFVFGAGVTASETRAAERVALVLVEEGSEAFGASPNAKDRGEAAANGLRALDFTVELAISPNDAASRAIVQKFARAAGDAEVAVAVLVGHAVSFRERAFFITTDSPLERSSDLRTRSLSAPALGRIAGRAKQGGTVLLLATSPKLPAIAGVVARPNHVGDGPDKATLAYSSSPRIPVTEVNRSAAAAAKRLETALAADVVKLSDLIDAVAGRSGLIVGAKPEITLRDPNAVVEPEPEPEPEAKSEPKPEPKPEPEAKPEPVAAPEPEIAPPAAADPGQGAASDGVAPPDPAGGVAAPDAAPDAAQPGGAQPGIAPSDPPARADQPAAAAEPEDFEGLLRMQRLLDRGVVMAVQRRLRNRGYYRGGIDGIIGDLTEEAIRAYQKDRDEPMTGVMTPQQLNDLFK